MVNINSRVTNAALLHETVFLVVEVLLALLYLLIQHLSSVMVLQFEEVQVHIEERVQDSFWVQSQSYYCYYSSLH